MDKNAFYYALSTIPQIVAAVSAILAVFLFRRLETLKNILIGDGKSIWDRSIAREYDFLFESDADASKEKKRQDLRLRDGISRKNIGEVKDIIKFYNDQENKAEKNGLTINKVTGLQYVYGKFCSTEELYNNIISFAKVTFIVSIISILFSVTSLSFANFIFSICASDIIIIVNLIIFILAILMSIVVVIKSFKEQGAN